MGLVTHHLSQLPTGKSVLITVVTILSFFWFLLHSGKNWNRIRPSLSLTWAQALISGPKRLPTFPRTLILRNRPMMVTPRHRGSFAKSMTHNTASRTTIQTCSGLFTDTRNQKLRTRLMMSLSRWEDATIVVILETDRLPCLLTSECWEEKFGKTLTNWFQNAGTWCWNVWSDCD